jgi:hypothetical protein
MNKKIVQYDYYGNIIVYKYLGRSYLSLNDAEKMRKFHWQKCLLQEEYFPISVSCQILGRPEFVNVEASLEAGVYKFYLDDEIEWMPIPKEEYNP